MMIKGKDGMDIEMRLEKGEGKGIRLGEGLIIVTVDDSAGHAVMEKIGIKKGYQALLLSLFDESEPFSGLGGSEVVTDPGETLRNYEERSETSDNR